jgi:hypothetical protein
MVEIIEVNTDDKAQVRQFLQLPFEIYKDVPQWVPPLANDAAGQLNRKKHPFFKHSDAAFLLAVRHSPSPQPSPKGRGGRTVGRLCILDNRNYNAWNKSRTAHFFLFECENNLETSRALFNAAFAWAKQRGLNHVEGPKGLTALDGLGLLVKGFSHRPALGIPYNRDYYAKLIEDAGFIGKGDILSGYVSPRTMNAEAWDRIERASELIQKRRGLRVSAFTTRGDMRKAVPELLQLYNGALGQSEGNVPFTPDEAKAMADQLIWFADPRLIKIVYKGDAPVGFLLAYPDISEAVKQTGGKLFPFGWITLLRALRKSDWVNVNGAGILEAHRGAGGSAVLFSELRKSVVAGGFAHADLVQISADNAKMQRELRDLGIDFYKTHRMYERKLDE